MAKKKLSALQMFKNRMADHEGCETKSVETRQSRRAATRKEKLAAVTNQYSQEPRPSRRARVLRPFRQKSRLNGPRGMRAAKQIAARRAV